MVPPCLEPREERRQARRGGRPRGRDRTERGAGAFGVEGPARRRSDGAPGQPEIDERVPCVVHARILARLVELDAVRIRHVVRAVADRLDGDWLLVGGALAAI